MVLGKVTSLQVSIWAERSQNDPSPGPVALDCFATAAVWMALFSRSILTFVCEPIVPLLKVRLILAKDFFPFSLSGVRAASSENTFNQFRGAVKWSLCKYGQAFVWRGCHTGSLIGPAGNLFDWWIDEPRWGILIGLPLPPSNNRARPHGMGKEKPTKWLFRLNNECVAQ